MSQSPTALAEARREGDASSEVGSGGEAQAILDVLDDADCRAILEATGTATLSANEISEACDLPLSTTYRKLEEMTDAGVLEERTRISQAGKHASEYAPLVEAVEVSIGAEDGISLRVSRREDDGNGRAWR